MIPIATTAMNAFIIISSLPSQEINDYTNNSSQL